MQTRKKLLIALCVIFCMLPNAYADALDEIEKFEACLNVAVQQLDDFISPASDIAVAAAARCRPSWQAALIANNEPLTKMEGYPSGAVQEAALRNVLMARREAIARTKNPPPRKAKVPNGTM